MQKTSGKTVFDREFYPVLLSCSYTNNFVNHFLGLDDMNKFISFSTCVVVPLCLAYSNNPDISRQLILYHKIEQAFLSLPPAVPKVQRRPARTFAKKQWTADEDSQLTTWYKEGVTLTEMGVRLGVDYYAVMYRARRLGLSKRSRRDAKPRP